MNSGIIVEAASIDIRWRKDDHVTYASDSLTDRPPRKAPAPMAAMAASMSVRMIQPIQAKAMRALVELQ